MQSSICIPSSLLLILLGAAALEPPDADGEGPEKAGEERNEYQIQPLELPGEFVKGTLLITPGITFAVATSVTVSSSIRSSGATTGTRNAVITK
eukprot:CAMPEP_0181031064 /NCGR_PEP_ID=MMETSP1070-20121207/6042_1 /TAXON_ID=265543 /ORGANISM="Minutocellus polymorphus, Strain NH13" /LENGTH=93 /DNA_ID=CAMNT_0023108435 /DNA_START=976 /DNA_END=1257 /DNA_ORIENTATION=+